MRTKGTIKLLPSLKRAAYVKLMSRFKILFPPPLLYVGFVSHKFNLGRSFAVPTNRERESKFGLNLCSPTQNWPKRSASRFREVIKKAPAGREASPNPRAHENAIFARPCEDALMNWIESTVKSCRCGPYLWKKSIWLALSLSLSITRIKQGAAAAAHVKTSLRIRSSSLHQEE